MHRGSSKAAGDGTPTAETLPLSAPGRPMITLEVELARAGRSERRRLTFPAGVQVREAVRAVGLRPEGAAVLQDDIPVPLDLVLESSTRLTIVPTFSGG